MAAIGFFSLSYSREPAAPKGHAGPARHRGKQDESPVAIEQGIWKICKRPQSAGSERAQEDTIISGGRQPIRSVHTEEAPYFTETLSRRLASIRCSRINVGSRGKTGAFIEQAKELIDTLNSRWMDILE